MSDGGEPLPRWDARTQRLTVDDDEAGYMVQHRGRPGRWVATTANGVVTESFASPQEAAGFLAAYRRSMIATPAGGTAARWGDLFESTELHVRPYVRLVPTGEPLPVGWATEPIGQVGGAGDGDAEVCYDPRRHDILVARGPSGGTFPTLEGSDADVVVDALGVSGWELYSPAPPQIWFRDRPVAELAAARHRAAGARPVVGFEDAGPGPPSKPFMRARGRGEPVPSGWIAEPAGTWEGEPADVVYNPVRHDVLRVSKSPSPRYPGGWSSVTAMRRSDETLAALASQGWERCGEDGASYLLVRDRVAQARVALEQAGQGPAPAVDVPDL